MTERDPTAEDKTLTEHVADAVVPDRVHVPLGLKLTVPVGVVAPEEEVSATIAVHEMAWPITGLDGVHATDVAVPRWPAEIMKVPKLVG